jgi:hypothetical protein
MEPYYNLTSDGRGLEGIMNYANNLVDGFLGVTFIFSIFVVMMYVLGKSEWRTSANLVYTSFVCLLLSWILTLFIAFPERVLYIETVIFAGAVVWSIIDRQSS